MVRAEAKVTKTYMLSKDSIDFIEDLRKRKGAKSASAVVEEIVRNARRKAEQVDEASDR